MLDTRYTYSWGSPEGGWQREREGIRLGETSRYVFCDYCSGDIWFLKKKRRGSLRKDMEKSCCFPHCNAKTYHTSTVSTIYQFTRGHIIV